MQKGTKSYIYYVKRLITSICYLLLSGGAAFAQQEHTEITPVYNGFRHVITYDERNNKICDIEQEFLNNKWTTIETEKTAYNAANKVTWFISPIWQNFFTYDARNNLLSFTRQYKYDSVYVNTERYFYTYDSNNTKTREIIQRWTNGEWVNKSRTTISPALQISQVWDSTQWINSVQQTLTHDARGNIICQLSQRWDGKQWENVERWTYTFDANNKQLTYVDEIWDGKKWGPWQPMRDPVPVK